ncbi:hypothetical protein H2199_009233 [Coniosporium tulheliwenetii]|uniref:Uncharacterized protein n=1 Tax=Coniosporium tulheliwenetii TaxID=3383036 RepID=A0ACC2YEW7_9PEZI|nr:hypothetical protein H2199_009233 [Cladosporium sp. JES 115]
MFSAAHSSPLGPRHRVLRPLHRRRNLAATPGEPGESDEVKLVAPGFMRLYSFYAPSLAAGPYSISASQVITPSNQGSKTKSTPPQKFNVVAPQFTIPSDDVHSVYPPPGGEAMANTLPHIVFNDPHLPWERDLPPGNPTPANKPSAGPSQPEPDTSKAPWLAVILFSQDELLHDASLVNSILPPPDPGTEHKQSETLSVPLSVAQLLATKRTYVPFSQAAVGVNVSTRTEAIFIKPDLFTALICSQYSTSSSKEVFNPPLTPTPADLSRYQYLAHVRNVNTTHCLDAGVEDTGIYSAIFSHRTGPIGFKTTQNVAVHLVSLEGWQKTTIPLTPKPEYVGLISLFSWTYRVLPDKAANFADLMKALGSPPPKGEFKGDDRLLRAPQALREMLNDTDASGKLIENMKARLLEGYSLVRYRTQTGETTVAYTRSPLTPVPVPPGSVQAGQSNFGTDFQLLDPTLGIMDITYSTAWQLGKTLAIADRNFATALSKLRSLAINAAMDKAKLKGFEAEMGREHRGKEHVMQHLKEAVDTLNGIGGRKPSLTAPGILPQLRGTEDSGRWFRPPKAVPNLTISNEKITGVLPDTLRQELKAHSSSVAAEVPVPSGSRPSTLPNYFPYASPPESLRFFYIDDNWMSALIDGALSIGNTLDVGPEGDVVKAAVKERLQEYLDAMLDPQTAAHKPQMPRFGFLLRSAVVSTWRDIVVSAPFPPSPHDRPAQQAWRGDKSEILSLTRMAKDTLFVLLDRRPDDKATVADIPPNLPNDVKQDLQNSLTSQSAVYLLHAIIISQPSHQQHFSLGTKLSSTELEMEYTNIDPSTLDKSTVDSTSALWDTIKPSDGPPFLYKTTTTSAPDKPLVFDWDNRIIRIKDLASTIKGLLDANVKPEAKLRFADVSSAVFGLQMNDKVMRLRVDGLVPPPPAPTPAPAPPPDPRPPRPPPPVPIPGRDFPFPEFPPGRKFHPMLKMGLARTMSRSFAMEPISGTLRAHAHSTRAFATASFEQIMKDPLGFAGLNQLPLTALPRSAKPLSSPTPPSSDSKPTLVASPAPQAPPPEGTFSIERQFQALPSERRLSKSQIQSLTFQALGFPQRPVPITAGANRPQTNQQLPATIDLVGVVTPLPRSQLNGDLLLLELLICIPLKGATSVNPPPLTPAQAPSPKSTPPATAPAGPSAPPTTAEQPYLTTAYLGPGPAILSNARFTITLDRPTTESIRSKYLTLRLRPRDRDGVNLLVVTQRIQWVLRGVATDGAPGAVEVVVFERLRRERSGLEVWVRSVVDLKLG